MVEEREITKEERKKPVKNKRELEIRKDSIIIYKMYDLSFLAKGSCVEGRKGTSGMGMGNEG